MRDPVIIGIATFDGPGRRESLRETLESLAPQADTVYVYANDYAPLKIKDAWPNVFVYTGLTTANGNIGDAGKFWVCESIQTPGKYHYFLTCDDDLIYPPDYVETIIAGIERYDRQAVVSFHGKEFYAPAYPWYLPRGGKRYACQRKVEKDARITLLGSGCAGWHSSRLSLTMDAFPQNGITMADIWFSKFLNDNDIPRYVLAHEAGWIRHTDKIDMNTTAWRINKLSEKKTDYITQVFNSVKWKL